MQSTGEKVQKPTAPSIEQLKSKWNQFVDVYQVIDMMPQTFFYTLLSLMKIPEAENILEVACGTGKLLPLAFQLKSKGCHYLATDLAENMVEKAKKNIAKWLEDQEIKVSMEEWLKVRNVEFVAANGQEFHSENKFDRIICNLVLMLTENPEKMLLNLANNAKAGCLLGLTVWGDKSKSNFLTLSMRARTQLGLPMPSMRTPFHLYNKIPELAEKTGWQVVMVWEQNAPFPFFQASQTIRKLILSQVQNDQKIADKCMEYAEQILKSKQSLNFPVQMAILRKL